MRAKKPTKPIPARDLTTKPLPAIAKPEPQEANELAPPTAKPEDLEDEQITERMPIAVAKLRSSKLRNLSAKPLPVIVKPESQEADELAPPTAKPEDLEDEQITERVPIAVAKLRSSKLSDPSAKPLRTIAKPEFPEAADVDIKRLPNKPKPKLSEVADIETKQVPAVPKLAEAANWKAKLPGLEHSIPKFPETPDQDTRQLRAISRPLSPAATDLIAYREKLAIQETRELQAFVKAQDQERAQAPTPTPTKTEEETKPKPKKSFFAMRKRVPVLQQVTMVECGAACLAMLLTYYGRKTSISEIREQCGLGRDGLSALNIVKAARKYGMRVRALSLKENDFRFVTLPAIVHWEFNHFLIVERWSPKSVELVDPALGRRRLTAQEFDDGFTGVVLVLEPGAHFQRENKPAKLSLGTYARNYLQQAPMAIIQVIGASLLLQLLGLVVPVLSEVSIDQIIPLKMLVP